MAERIPDSLIDEILASAKNYIGEETTVDYSAEKIDSLLAELSDERPQVSEKTVVAPNFRKEKKEFSLDMGEVSLAEETDEVKVLEKTGEVDILVTDDGQIGLTSDGVEISSESDILEPEEAEEKEELKSVSGQISIEKTRMFNEVDIRGAYNPNISHNLGNKVTRTTTGEAQPLSSSAIGEEKYRKHFMNKPVQNLEKTQEHRDLLASLPQKTIETPGVVVKKSKQVSTNTDGFEPLPTIVPAEYELEQEKTRFDLPKVQNDDIPDNQIMLDGFGDDNEPVIVQSEEQAEAELREARKDKVKQFMDEGVLFKQEVEESTPKKRFERQKQHIACEYFGPKEKTRVEDELYKEKSSLTFKTIALSVICFAMSFLAAVAGAENGNFELYGNNEYVYVLVQLILLLVATGMNFRSVTNTVKNLKEKIVDMDTVITASVLAGVIQCIFGFAFTDNVESTACLMAGGALVPMIMKTVGELVRCKNDINNFYIVSDEEHEIFNVQNIPDEETSNEIARGLMLGDPDIKYSAKIDFPVRFVELSRSAEVTGPLFKITVPVICLIALLVGIIYGIVSKNFFAGTSTFTGIILMGLPVGASLLSAVNLSSANKKLNAEGTVINGYSAVEDAVNSNGVMIDACDAFVSGGCNIEGMKLYHKMRIDEAILYTASVIIESGGVLADVFEGVIIGKRELLFPVESLSYEEKLGCSCWIHNHRVLVGNRELLVHHNVDVPDKELEEKYKASGRNVIYLAIEGKISAMFIVVYKANEETARYMRELEKDGLTIFFRTSDANITEGFLEQEFGLPSNVVKIINPVAGEMFTKVKSKDIPRADAKIIHNGKVQTMLSALHSAFAISSYVTVSKIVQMVASFIGVAIVTLLAFLSGLAQIGVWQIIIYQAAWAIVLSVLPNLRKI